jgi:hypothetical protein
VELITPFRKNELVTKRHKWPRTWTGLDLVGIQEVRWEIGGTEPAGEYIFCYEKGNENNKLGTRSFIHKRIISAVKRV